MRLFKKYISVHKPATIISKKLSIRYSERLPGIRLSCEWSFIPTTEQRIAIFTASMLLILTISGVRHLDLIMNLPPVPVWSTISFYMTGIPMQKRPENISTDWPMHGGLLEMHKGIFISTQQKWISSRTICGRLRCFIFHIQKKAGSLLWLINIVDSWKPYGYCKQFLWSVFDQNIMPKALCNPVGG